MTGVNDLTDYRKRNRACAHIANYTECALREISKNVWHPASKPPSREDADDLGWVMLYSNEGCVFMDLWEHYSQWKEEADYWARIKDVVLLPEDCK